MFTIKSWLRSHRNLVLYIVIGVLGAVVDFAFYTLLVSAFKVNPAIANIFSSAAGIINNFFFNAIFNFQKSDKLKTRFIKFFSIAIGGIILGSTIIFVLTQILQVNPIISKVISLLVVMIFQYNLNKRVSFK